LIVSKAERLERRKAAGEKRNTEEKMPLKEKENLAQPGTGDFHEPRAAVILSDRVTYGRTKGGEEDLRKKKGKGIESPASRGGRGSQHRKDHHP